MAHPIFDAPRYPLHRPEAVALFNMLSKTVVNPSEIDLIYRRCVEYPDPLNLNQRPRDIWMAALDNLTIARGLRTLCGELRDDGRVKDNREIQNAILAVENAQPVRGGHDPRVKTKPAGPDTVSLRLARTLGWLLLLAGVLGGVAGPVLKGTRFGAYFPTWAQSQRDPAWPVWALVTAAFVLIGTALISRAGWRGLRGWLVASACLALVGAVLWWHLLQYTTLYQIAEIRRNNLVRFAAAESDQRRMEVLTGWAVALALDGRVEEALRAAASTDPGDPDADPRLAVAAALERVDRHAEAETAWNDAAKAARNQPQLDDQCRALASLARAQIRAKRLIDAKTIAAEAREKAGGSVSITTRVQVLVASGQALTCSKDEEAKEVWVSAVAASQTLSDLLQRYLAFASVARRAAEVGERSIARNALKLAREVVFPKPEFGPRPEDRPDAVAADMTASFIQENEVDKANTLADEIRDPALRARSLVAVAAALEVLDRKPEAARVWTAAVAACVPDRDAASQALASASVAAALDRAEREPHEAERLWSQAFLATRRVPDESRNAVFCELAAALVRARRVDRALQDAGYLRIPGQRSAAFTRVGQALLLAPEVRPQPESVERAYNAAQGIEEDQLRSPAVAAVAKGLARLDHFREARLRGNECNRSLDQLDSYAAIMQEYLSRPH